MLEEFAGFELEEPKKREKCSFCERPQTVCFCSSITPISTRHTIVMLQHPMEIRRVLRTTKILELSLQSESYHLFRGKRFFKTHFRQLYEILDIDVFGEKQEDSTESKESSEPKESIESNELKDKKDSIEHNGQVHKDIETILVYPSENSIPITELPRDKQYRIVFLDGTWAQARTMYNSNPILQQLRAVKIDESLLVDQRSKYVIRTQPKEICVSTVEAVALVLAELEQRPDIYERLTEPLKAICDFQLENGAVEHQSKEYMIANGLYRKQINHGMTNSHDQD